MTDRGATAIDPHLPQLLAAGAAAGVPAAVLEAMGDRRLADVVRQRAVGRLARTLL